MTAMSAGSHIDTPREAEAPTDAPRRCDYRTCSISPSEPVDTLADVLLSSKRAMGTVCPVSLTAHTHRHTHTNTGELAYSEAGTGKHVIISTHTHIHMEIQIPLCTQLKQYSSTVLYNLEVIVIYFGISIFCCTWYRFSK